MPTTVRGMGLSVDERRLWVGQHDAVVALDPSSGQLLAKVSVRGLVSLGPVSAKD